MSAQPPVPPYAGAYVPPPPTNNLAVVSLVLSLVGVLTCGITGIPGFVTGLVSLSQIKRTRESGHAMALAGTIVGGIFTAFFALMLVLFVVGTFTGPITWSYRTP